MKVRNFFLVCVIFFGISSLATAGKLKPFEIKDTGPKLWMQTGVNQIENSSFSNSAKGWGFFYEGGNATASYGKNKVRITITSRGSVDYGVQFYYDGFRLYNGGKYKLTFKASADAPKGLQARLQINGGDYHPYAQTNVELNSEEKEFSLAFTMTEESDVTPRLCFNMGNFGKIDATDEAVITLSDVSLILENEVVAKEKTNGGADFVRINQVGYLPSAKKIAYVKVTETGGKFNVLDKDGKIVFSAKLSKPVREPKALEYTAAADFSAFKQEGVFVVESNGNQSFPFTISNNVYDNLMSSALNFFYLQRCGSAIQDDTFGHKACHTGSARIIGTYDNKLVTGGWHDAGDYGRYVVAGAKAVADLLLAYDNCKTTFSSYDMLSEIRHELDWMLQMQRDDGAVYHKITCRKFPPYEMPDEETEQLVLSPVSTPATGDFAAVLALAYVEFKESDSDYAATLLAAAKKAYTFLKASKAISFSNTTGVETGAYPDNYDKDERYFAATALFEATGDETYINDASEIRLSETGKTWESAFGWAQMEGYGDEIVIRNKSEISDKAFVDIVTKAVTTNADKLVKNSKSSGFRVALTDFVWGSNMNVLDAAHLLNNAYVLTGKSVYKETAIAQVDYILGCNPLTMCYVTGNGSNSPVAPHHRPSIAKNKPMPGMLVGGPDQHLDDPFAQNLLEEKPPLQCYLDNYQSFSTNEVTIYWNSPLVYALSALYYSAK